MQFRQTITASHRGSRVRSPLVSHEPTLEEMLRDPIIRARMLADGVHVSMVRQVVHDAIRRHRA